MSAKLIVADAGPLIALAVAGVLPQCVTMLGGLLVPEPVWAECIADPFAPGASIIQALQTKLITVPHGNLAPLDTAYAQGLGGGEIAVLSYAAQNDLIALVDERRARSVAQRLGIAIIGSGAVLVALKKQGYVARVQSIFALWARHGYFVSPKLQSAILQRAGE